MSHDTIKFTGDRINDFALFEQAIKNASPLKLESASVILTKFPSLWRGDILERFFISGMPQFEDWMLAERARAFSVAD